MASSTVERVERAVVVLPQRVVDADRFPGPSSRVDLIIAEVQGEAPVRNLERRRCRYGMVLAGTHGERVELAPPQQFELILRRPGESRGHEAGRRRNPCPCLRRLQRTPDGGELVARGAAEESLELLQPFWRHADAPRRAGQSEHGFHDLDVLVRRGHGHRSYRSQERLGLARSHMLRAWRFAMTREYNSKPQHGFDRPERCGGTAELDDRRDGPLARAVAALLEARDAGPDSLIAVAYDLEGLLPQGHPVRSIVRRIRALGEDGAELPRIDAELGRLHGALSHDVRQDPRVAELAEQVRRDHGVALRNAARVHRGDQARAEDSVQNHIETLLVSIALELPLDMRPYTVRSTYRRAGDLRRAESARIRASAAFAREADLHASDDDEDDEDDEDAHRRVLAALAALREILRSPLTPLERRVLRATWHAAREGRQLTREELAREAGSRCPTHASRLRARMVRRLAESYRRALDRIDGV